MQRGGRAGNATRNNTLDFGDYGLQVLDRGWVSAQQIEAVRVTVNRYLKRRGKLWIRVFPDKPFSQKPLEVRMGKGKGNPEGWVAVVKPGNLIVELSGCGETMAREAFARAAQKLPYRCRFITRHGA